MHEETYDVKCKYCQRLFPIVIQVEKDGKGAKTFEEECPHCDKEITIELPDNLTVFSGDSALRSL